MVSVTLSEGFLFASVNDVCLGGECWL